MTLYPIDWSGGVTTFRRECREAVRRGGFEGLSDAATADIFRERAKLLDALEDGERWTVADVDRSRRGWRVRPQLDRAIRTELEWFRQGRDPTEYHPRVAPGVASKLRLLADQLDPECSVLEMHRRWRCRSANRYRRRGDDAEAERYLDMMRRITRTHNPDGTER